MTDQDPLQAAATPPNSASTMTEEVLERTHRAIAQVRAATKHITQGISLQNATFPTVLRPLAHAENALRNETNLLIFHASAHPEPAVRQASTEVGELLDDFHSEQGVDEAMFHLVNAVVLRREDLSHDDQRFLEMKYRTFIQHGLLLPDQMARERLREMRREISRDSVAFQANLANRNGGLWFSREELKGVSERTLQSMQVGTSTNQGKLRVTFSNAHLAGVLRFAQDGEVRRKVFIGNENQSPENVDLFRNVVLRRDEVARLLGYTSHAALILEDRMARTPETVEAFHEDLRERLRETSEMERKRLRALKAKDLGVEEAGMGYYLWDQPYYHRMMVEREFAVDQERVSEWFPLEIVVERMLRVFEEIFALKFVLGDGSEGGNGERPEIWYEDVQIFPVYDQDDGGAFLGWLYMDLYERRGKRGSPFNQNLVPGFLRNNGSRQHPSTALLCSFAKPILKAPCLLRHEEVVTLFHELGHGIHDLVSKTSYACFHGTEVAVDFGEAPSQMLEEWCWTPDVLKRLSKHYSTLSDEYLDHWKNSQTTDGGLPEETLPDGMIASLIAARNVNAAHFYLNQLRLSMFDMAVHSPRSHEELKAMDISATLNEIRSQVFPPRGPEALGEGFKWGHGQVLNGHVMQEDYSAGYYSYMFSKVFAADMFQSAFKKDPMSRVEGLRYRYAVLEKGGSRNAMEMLTEFLGRPPESAAFNELLSSRG